MQRVACPSSGGAQGPAHLQGSHRCGSRASQVGAGSVKKILKEGMETIKMTHLILKETNFTFCARVSFPNNWDDVDFVMDPAHHLHVQRLQPMSSRSNEV